MTMMTMMTIDSRNTALLPHRNVSELRHYNRGGKGVWGIISSNLIQFIDSDLILTTLLLEISQGVLLVQLS